LQLFAPRQHGPDVFGPEEGGSPSPEIDGGNLFIPKQLLLLLPLEMQALLEEGMEIQLVRDDVKVAVGALFRTERNMKV
jgi:hypothetical protein